MKILTILMLAASVSYALPNASDSRGVADNVVDVQQAKILHTFLAAIDKSITEASKVGSYSVTVRYGDDVQYDVVYAVVLKLRSRGYTVNIDRGSHMIAIEWGK